MTRILVIAVVLAGCSSFIDERAATSTYRILVKSQEAARRQPDLELAREAMPGGLMQLQSFALAYPAHREFRTLHAETLCQYTVAFVFDDWEDASLRGRTAEADQLAARLTRLVGMCVDANLALLPPAWREARARGSDAMIALLPKATRTEVPQLLWIATADAVQLALSPVAHLAQLPAITAMLERCTELAPGGHDADGEVLLGTLKAGRSRFFGGPDGSAELATARKMLGEGALTADVMMARGVAVARKDRALFETTLQRVLETDLDRWPERRLANELAKRKARRYLDAANTLLR